MEKKIGELLAKTQLMTNFEIEPDPYILTVEEEQSAIDHAVLRLQQHMEWKMKGEGYSNDEILTRIKAKDWEQEIDRKAILDRRNSAKIYEKWQKEQRESEQKAEIARVASLQANWTAQNIYRLMRWTSEKEFQKPLILNDSNRRLISALCFFASRDGRFETELGYSFDKGLLIRGISGLGKTHLVQCIRKNELNPILILSMLEIADEIRLNGEYNINLGNDKIIYLDDVGTEEATVNHYGTKINFFKNFIEMIYLRNAGKNFNRLMISTNNSFAEIEEKYGFRVRSRMKDMFNVIDISGTDMRG